MQLNSTAFQHIETIPVRHSQQGENLSPPLMWSDLPTGTVSLAILCEDPDAPLEPGREDPFVHWLLYNLPADTGMLPEGLPTNARLTEPVRCQQGLNSRGEYGYMGPHPPAGHGMHRYIFRLYALRKFLVMPVEARRANFYNEIDGAVLGTAELIGTFETAAMAGESTFPAA